MATSLDATAADVCPVHRSPMTPVRYPRPGSSYCETCAQQREEAQRKEIEEAARHERQRTMVYRSGLVGRQLQASFDNFSATTSGQRKVLEACRGFVSEFSPDQGAGLWLIGPPGTGKTHLGCAMVQGVIYGYTLSAQILSAREIVRRLRDTWRRDAPEREADVIEDLASAALLVLDEVGVGFGTEGEQVQLFDVLDERYKRQAPTVLLSNLTVSMLPAVLGDRLFDRLREGSKVLVCDWPSHRKGAGNA